MRLRKPFSLSGLCVHGPSSGVVWSIGCPLLRPGLRLLRAHQDLSGEKRQRHSARSKRYTGFNFLMFESIMFCLDVLYSLIPKYFFVTKRAVLKETFLWWAAIKHNSDSYYCKTTRVNLRKLITHKNYFL